MTTLTTSSVGDLRTLLPDFQRSLRAANKSPKTVRIYTDAGYRLATFLLDSGMPTEVAKIKREHVEAFMSRTERCVYGSSRTDARRRP
jgi:hypothetical protein